MAETDTAAPSVDTAPDAFSSAPSPDLLAWLRPDDVEETPVVEPEATEPVETEPDTENAPASETETPETAPETEAPSLLELIKGKTDDEIADIPEIKSLLARTSESVRRKTEAQSAAQHNAERVNAVATGAVNDELINLMSQADMDSNGNPVLPREKVAGLTTDIMGAGIQNAIVGMGSVLSEAAGEGFQLTNDELESVKAAWALYNTKPTDPSPVMRAYLKPYDRYRDSLRLEELKAEATRQVKAEQAAAAKADKAKAATDSRRGPGATPVSGQPVQNANEWDAANAALSDPDPARRLAALRTLAPNISV